MILEEISHSYILAVKYIHFFNFKSIFVKFLCKELTEMLDQNCLKMLRKENKTSKIVPLTVTCLMLGHSRRMLRYQRKSI